MEANAKLQPGIVLRVEPGVAATVRLQDGRVVRAANALHVRTPPGARVLVTRTTAGLAIVGRPRAS